MAISLPGGIKIHIRQGPIGVILRWSIGSNLDAMIPGYSVADGPVFASRELMKGQTSSVWLEIWWGAFWRYFETIRRLWSKFWSLRHCRCRELLSGCRRSEVRPNDVEMVRNFMCTPLLAALKDLAVFVWFWQDLVLEVAPSYLWQDVAPCSFWCWRDIVTFLVSTNALSRYSDEVRSSGSRCASKRIWRRSSCLTKSLEHFSFDGVAFSSFQGISW